MKRRFGRGGISLIAAGILFAVTAASFGVLISTAGARSPLPDNGKALPELNRSAPSANQLKPNEAQPSTLAVQSEQVVASSGRSFLLQVGSASSSAGRARAVFVMYEVDPDVNEWRPVTMIDGDLKRGLNYEAIRLPDGFTYIGWLGAGSRAVAYRAKTGQMKPLGRGAAGFAPMPSDAAPLVWLETE